MKSTVDTLLKKHQKLIQSDHLKVASHVQREADDWIVNTLMIEGHNIPFIYKRKRPYRSLAGQRVNMTYYAAVENVAGIEFDVMKVVRIRIA